LGFSFDSEVDTDLVDCVDVPAYPDQFIERPEPDLISCLINSIIEGGIGGKVGGSEMLNTNDLTCDGDLELIALAKIRAEIVQMSLSILAAIETHWRFVKLHRLTSTEFPVGAAGVVTASSR